MYLERTHPPWELEKPFHSIFPATDEALDGPSTGVKGFHGSLCLPSIFFSIFFSNFDHIAKRRKRDLGLENEE
jgi:hypothetical protein